MFDVVVLIFRICSNTSSASRSFSDPSYTRYGGIGAICMLCYEFVTLDLARRGYVYIAPLLVIVVENCASVITAIVFFSTIYYGRHRGCGGPNSWLPSPCRNKSFPSTCVGVSLMVLVCTPTQYTTFTRCVFGTFTSATFT